jgi:hypothetical protein
MVIMCNFCEFPSKSTNLRSFVFYPYFLSDVFLVFFLSRGLFLSFFVLYEENHMFLTVCDGSVINGQL